MSISHESGLYLGLDIGGSSVKYGWGNQVSGLAFFDKIPLTDSSLSSVRHALGEIIRLTDSQLGLDNISGIGMGLPGNLNRNTGRLTGVNPNLPQLLDIAPAELLPQELRPRLAADNDANLMAWAEAEQLPGKECVIGITVGSGIGCGCVINSRLYRGSRGYAMELGHTLVAINGEVCNCSRSGCLEAYASVNGMLNRLKRAFPSMTVNSLDDIIQSSIEDGNVRQILDEAIRYLSISIANLVVLMDADAVVIGGGAAECKGYPLTELQEGILAGLPLLIRDQVIVSKAVYGNQAGTWGAIILAEESFPLR